MDHLGVPLEDKQSTPLGTLTRCIIAAICLLLLLGGSRVMVSGLILEGKMKERTLQRPQLFFHMVQKSHRQHFTKKKDFVSL